MSTELVMVGQVYHAYLDSQAVDFGSLTQQQPAEPCDCWVFVNQGNVTSSTKWLPPIELQAPCPCFVAAQSHEQG